MRTVVAGAVRAVYTVRTVWVWLLTLPVLATAWVGLSRFVDPSARIGADALNQGMSLAAMFTVIGMITLTVAETKRGSLPWIFAATRSRAGFASAHVLVYVLSVLLAAVTAVALAAGLASALDIADLDLGDGRTWRTLLYGIMIATYSTLLFCPVGWITRSLVVPLGIFIGLVFLIEPMIAMVASNGGSSVAEFLRDVLPYVNMHHLAYGADATYITGHSAWGNAVVLAGWVVLAWAGMWIAVRRRVVE